MQRSIVSVISRTQHNVESNFKLAITKHKTKNRQAYKRRKKKTTAINTMTQKHIRRRKKVQDRACQVSFFFGCEGNIGVLFFILWR